MSFNLFAAEDQAIEQAQGLGKRLAEAAPDLVPEFDSLLDSFRRSIREQRRLVRVSDRLQAQIASANQELERRRQEAETALTRLRDAQEAIVQAEKLASLGALVAGVAHEINTPVGIAVSCASHLADQTVALRRRSEEGQISRGDFDRYLTTATDTTDLILANCQRAAQLITAFKQVAVDRASAERRTVRLGAYISEVLTSLQPKLRPAGHTVTVACPPDLVVDSFPGALSQLLTNLVMNALTHAYPDGRPGTLTVTVTVGQPDEETVRLVVADDGCGIPAEHHAAIFEPFFTTRRGSGGSGLGLHIVHNLVAGVLKGTITVASVPGAGTAFTIDFPRRTPDEAA
ncbi:sensor histidine kinase [Azospirillum thermophilum]|uniref:histidine kinase n=1 Tax=Azospirillum thermophilum TaxID=2202148 RepID=A0A2S2CRI0_9PROT|nr:ATP-binding protein [Azospirillum thermophilum]AWK87086.1 histidine kinase [Azospirillum thermophilum]